MHMCMHMCICMHSCVTLRAHARTGYPKLKLAIYFDSADENTGETCAIGNRTFRQGPPYSDTPSPADGGPSNVPLFEASHHHAPAQLPMLSQHACDLR